MSFDITYAFVQQYGSAVEHLAQQKGSRLRNRVTVMTGTTGTRVNFDQIGKVTAQTPVSRHADSPQIDTPHHRRVIDMIDKEVGDLIDNEDMVRTLIDPTNAYTQAFGFALGRAMDAEILRAANATATIGDMDGLTATTEAFPAAQNFAATGDGAGSTGTTGVRIEDLIKARHILRANEVLMDGEPVTCVCSSETISDLLNEPEIQSIDQNTYRALAGGEVGSFMGFDFVQTELVGGIATASEKVYVFPRSAIRLAIGRDITHYVERRPDKRFAMYAYSSMTIGATRTQSNNVVTITVDHSDAFPA